jgi:hypothetical protein
MTKENGRLRRKLELASAEIQRKQDVINRTENSSCLPELLDSETGNERSYL